MVRALILAMFILVSCASPEVRFDAAIAPIDINRHTVLMEVIQNGETRLGFGQGAVSYDYNEIPNGKLLVHTPLPGSISLYSNRCGIQEKEYHPWNGGAFEYDLGRLFESVPSNIPTCVVNIYISWELPPKWTSELPLSGMSARLYYRRRPEKRGAPVIKWTPGFKSVGTMKGVAYGQFRAFSRDEKPFPVAEPLLATIELDQNVTSGKYRIFGCGNGIEVADFSGKTIEILRSDLISNSPVQGECMMLGWVMGKLEDGSDIEYDLAMGISIYSAKAVLLSGKFSAGAEEICYDTENSVTGCVLNYNETNELSNKLSHCFKRPETGQLRLGCWTHKGRAVYGIINGNEVEYVH